MQKTKEKKLKNKYWKKKEMEKNAKSSKQIQKKTYSKQNKDLSKNISIVL